MELDALDRIAAKAFEGYIVRKDLVRLDATQGPGAGMRLLNQPPPAPLKESVRCAEQNLYVRARELDAVPAPSEQ